VLQGHWELALKGASAGRVRKRAKRHSEQSTDPLTVNGRTSSAYFQIIGFVLE
jgi:hypothetical protein